jgi:predicted RNA-binding protein YlqC (UPF0109 family)
MKDILVYLLTNIVDTPDEVAVDESEADGVTTFTIHVAPTDMGKVIGKEGKIIRSIRNILKVKAMKEDKRIYVTLAE